MLTEILMESLMSMDEDTLDYVLESCSDEEIELIDDMVTEARIEDGPTRRNPKRVNIDVLTNVGKNLKSRGYTGWGPDYYEDLKREPYRALPDPESELRDSYKSYKEDKQKSKQQGAENARNIRAANLKSKLFTGEPLRKSGKLDVIGKKKEKPAYREANAEFDYNRSMIDSKDLAKKKLKEIKKARALRG